MFVTLSQWFVNLLVMTKQAYLVRVVGAQYVSECILQIGSFVYDIIDSWTCRVKSKYLNNARYTVEIANINGFNRLFVAC